MSGIRLRVRGIMTSMPAQARGIGPPVRIRWWVARLGLALALLAGLPGSAGSDGTRAYVIDPARSQLRFHAVSRFMNADGVFTRFRGEVRLDDARPETASGQLTVEVGSLDTGNRMRDSHLRTDDFFDVERHPQATFVVSTVRRAGDRWAVSGQLTIRGVTRPVVVPITVSTSAGAVRTVGEFTLNRREFGVSYQSFLNPIRDEVRVSFDLTALRR